MKHLLFFLFLIFYKTPGIFAQHDTVLLGAKQLVKYNISPAGDRLIMGSPDDVGIDAEKLETGIADIVNRAIDSMAFPGAQILIAKEGVIFYQKAFGYHTYAKEIPVDTTAIYDLASITKATAATLALMRLRDMELFDPNQTMGYYFPKVARRKKRKLVMREVLAHQAGLKPWIPYWSESQRRNGKFRRKTVSRDSSVWYPYRISTTGLFMHRDFIRKKLYKMIRKSKVSKKKEYVYSGLVFYLIPELVRRLTGKPFDQFLYDEFYEPMGAHTLKFNAGKYFDKQNIVPTEIDTFFRMQTLHGVVHDEGAAMMLGISGNAGLFGNAGDLAKIYQMLLNGGKFEGKTYLTPGTIQEFTSCQFCESGNRRGMGFDKPLVEYDPELSSVAKAASPASFGHSGYTGTLVWADPQNDLLFVFLTNRVYPTRNNSKIYDLNVRPDIHNLVYELLRIGK